MLTLPIEPYLIELLMAMDRQSCQLTICGGLAIYLKRRWIVEQIERYARVCLFDPRPLPNARATDDIDAILSMQVFAGDRSVVTRYRSVIDSLGYDAVPGMEYLHFFKSADNLSDRKVKLELLARAPLDEETPPAKVRKIRVGRQGGAWDDLNAFYTPEAFAIDHGVQRLPLAGTDPHGNAYEGFVGIPHPFASLCMKIRAALDHERRPVDRRKPRGEKHAFDVYLLMAMLDRDERDQVEAYARDFAGVPELTEIRNGVTELFQGPTSPGCETITNNTRENVDLAIFCDTISELLGSHAVR
jgi:hypothetical protein